MKITGTSSDGRGITHIDGMTVFVDGGVCGDDVEIKIIRQKKSYAEGVVTGIIEPSPYRIEPECPYFCECGGCHTAHTDYEFELRNKANAVEQAMRRIGGFADFTLDTIESGSPCRYRNKAVYKIDGTRLGFYSQRSHNLIGIDDCLLCSKNDKKIINAVSEYIKLTGAEFTELFVRRAKTAMVTLYADKRIKNTDILIQNILDCDKTVSSIIINVKGKSEVIFGDDYISEDLLGIEFRISEQSFFQVNPEMTEVLYKRAIEYADITKNDDVFDIYCGIGTISLCASKKAKTITGIEIVPQAIKNAKDNARLNNINNAEFYAGKAEVVVPRLVADGKRPSVVILDPPRKGSDEATLKAVLAVKPQKIVYVSCNPSTLARDAKFLADGGYQIEKASAVDMFPRTCHVETVVLLQRRDM